MNLENWKKTEKYIPLTYIEAVKGKPLVVKLTDEWTFTTQLQKVINFTILIDNKDYITTILQKTIEQETKNDTEKIQKQTAIITAFRGLIDILFTISCDNQKDKDAYRKFLFEYLLNDTDATLDLWNKVLDYNTRLEKKNRIPEDLRDNSRGRVLDKWRGFLAGRTEYENKTFLMLLHEDEEQTTRMINQHKRSKENEKKNRHSKIPG